MEIMKQGQIECKCGNIYYFQSIRDEIICMKCGKRNSNNGESVPELEVELCEDIDEEKIKDETEEE